MGKMRLPFIDSNVLYRGADFYYIYIKYTLEWMYHLILVNISGYTEGSTEVQRFTSIGVNNFAYNYNVTLAHTSVIYVTIIATNAAGLMTKVHARSLLVDLTLPNIIFVNDGIGTCI